MIDDRVDVGGPTGPRDEGEIASDHSGEVEALVQRAGAGEHEALGALFARHRERLLWMVRLRMDRRLQGRMDPSDILQEAYLDLTERIAEYADLRPKYTFFLWLRLVVSQRLQRIHRHHLGAAMRDADREVSLYRGSFPRADSASLAEQLLGRFTPASAAAARAELQLTLQAVLDAMDPDDREVIVLRNLEELSNGEAAQVLGIKPAAASQRYVRALRRLKAALMTTPGFSDFAAG
jgi:RNA polymerase sigma-70 factor (ECF subfamily)